jgi:ribonuclease BN (tRNA processing enzyme)
MQPAVTVLGSSGTWASATSACSGYLVTDGTTRVWIDCGPGTLSALQQHCPVADVDALIVTHSHPDHCMELPVLRNAMKYGLGLERLMLYAPRDVLRLLETLLGAQGIAPTFTLKMVGDRSRVQIGGLSVSFSRTDHPVETLAVRIEPVGGGPVVVYTADTGPGWEPSRFGDRIDLAFMEATLLAADVEAAEAVHLTARQTGQMAKAAGVRRLVITHVPPTGDPETHRLEAEAAFGGPVELAIPHATYEV